MSLKKSGSIYDQKHFIFWEQQVTLLHIFGQQCDSLNVYFSLQILKPWFLQYLFILVYVSVCNDGRHFFVNFEALGVSL